MRVHLGCGKRYIPGFVHVDHLALPHIDYCRDVRDLSCFDTSSVELLYASHVFEYFDRQEAPSVLAEWRRVLAPGGILRLSVPDFAVITRLYQAGLPIEWFVGALYGRIEAATPGQCIYHKTVYDRASLSAVLIAAGLERCELWDWRTTEHAHVDDFSQAYFPHMQKDRGVLFNLNLQAYAPALQPADAAHGRSAAGAVSVAAGDDASRAGARRDGAGQDRGAGAGASRGRGAGAVAPRHEAGRQDQA